jgi:signal transduction histidine kinase
MKQAGNQVLISIADQGAGIPEALREQATERFVRLEESRTQPGSGLGLSLAKAVMKLHGGSLMLEDNAPGLRVVLAFPALTETKQ